MKPARIVAATAAAIALCALPAYPQQKVQLRFGTVGIGSAWYNYGAGIADLVKPRLPAGSSIDVLPRAGGVGNLKLVQAGEIELGLSFANNSAEACGGFNTFKEKQDKVRAVLGGLDVYYFGTFVTRKSGVTSWEDIVAGKNRFHLLTTRPGGTGELAVRQVLALLGSSKEAVAKNGGMIEATERSGAAEEVKDGQAGGWAHIVTKGHPGATQLVTINDMIMLPLPDKVVKGMVENADKLRKIHAALADFDPKIAANPGLNGNCPLHPGAQKYYREAGMLK